MTNDSLPQANIVRRHRRAQWVVWLVPLVALLIALSIAWHEYANRGPEITITFESASGLEEGKTQIRFRDVVVGLVENIRLSEHSDVVLVEARLDKEAAGLANDSTMFWIVKPTVGLEGVSGLSTLLSGAYIEADSEHPFDRHHDKYDFSGLESPPPIKSDRPGKAFRLRADSLGSLAPGVRVYYLRIPVGIVTGYQLDKDGRHVDIDIFIDAPYDSYVRGNTRFWNESGIYFNVGADGVTIRTESLASIISGGIAFASFGQALPVEEDHMFTFYDDRAQAEALPTGPSIPVMMRFAQSGGGLNPGAAITFQGLTLGQVDQVELDFDREQVQFYTIVRGTLYPESLGGSFASYIGADRSVRDMATHLDDFVRRGLRAQIASVGLLSSNNQIALRYIKDAQPAGPLSMDLPLEIPTVASEGLDDLQNQVTRIVERLEKIPFESIGEQLDESLKSLRQLSDGLDDAVRPELTQTLTSLRATLDSVDRVLKSSTDLPGRIDGTIDELESTVRATRALIDELRAQPNSLIFGVPQQSYSRDDIGKRDP